MVCDARPRRLQKSLPMAPWLLGGFLVPVATAAAYSTSSKAWSEANRTAALLQPSLSMEAW